MKNFDDGVIREASEIEEDEVKLLSQISDDLAQRVVEYNKFKSVFADDDNASSVGKEDNDIMKSITEFGQGLCFSRPTGTVSQRYLSQYDETRKNTFETRTNDERISCIVALVLGTGLHVPLFVD